MTTLEALQEIVRDLIGEPGAVLSPASKAADFAGWDSVRQVAIVLAVEERFGLRFRAREIDGLRCVQDIIDLIEARTG